MDPFDDLLHVMRQRGPLSEKLQSALQEMDSTGVVSDSLVSVCDNYPVDQVLVSVMALRRTRDLDMIKQHLVGANSKTIATVLFHYWQSKPLLPVRETVVAHADIEEVVVHVTAKKRTKRRSTKDTVAEQESDATRAVPSVAKKHKVKPTVGVPAVVQRTVVQPTVVQPTIVQPTVTGPTSDTGSDNDAAPSFLERAIDFVKKYRTIEFRQPNMTSVDDAAVATDKLGALQAFDAGFTLFNRASHRQNVYMGYLVHRVIEEERFKGPIEAYEYFKNKLQGLSVHWLRDRYNLFLLVKKFPLLLYYNGNVKTIRSVHRYVEAAVEALGLRETWSTHGRPTVVDAKWILTSK